MAPPEVSAASRAPRRAAQPPVDASRCSSAPRAPAPVAMPSDEHVDDRVEVVARRAPRTARRGGTSANELVLVAAPRPRAAATICCARTSSGASRSATASISPRARRAHERRALDQLVAREREEAALRRARRSAWPERPMRCSASAIERGEPSWQTRSTAPTSMPSSSDAVATTTRSSPALRRCSASMAPLAREAAVVRGDVLLAEPLARGARDALDQAPRVDEDQRRPVLARQRGDAVVELVPLLVGARPRRARRPGPRSPRSRSRRWPDVDDRRAARRALRPAAAPRSRSAARVAESPMRCRRSPGAPTSASSRSSESARCAPRLSPATAWISSTITVAHVARAPRRPARTVSRMKSDSGVVTRTCGGCGAACAALARPACRRCAPRCGRRAPGSRARSRARAARRAAPRGSGGRRSTAP